MAQLGLFDVAEGRRRRDEGKARVASLHADWLEQTRRIAVWIAKTTGTVTTDDLRAAGVELPALTHHNLWGSVLDDSRFESCGFERSKRPAAHRRVIQVWRLA